MRIVNYYIANPKEGPLVVTTNMLYREFSKLYGIHYTQGMNDSDAAKYLKLNPYILKNYKSYARHYTLAKTIKAIDIIYEYNQYAVGMNIGNSSQTLLKELTIKLLSL
jgi:hypothetical protein